MCLLIFGCIPIENRKLIANILHLDRHGGGLTHVWHSGSAGEGASDHSNVPIDTAIGVSGFESCCSAYYGRGPPRFSESPDSWSSLLHPKC